MSLSIQDFNHRYFAECDHIKVHGLPGIGSYILCVELDFRLSQREDGLFLRHLNLRIDWHDQQQRMIGTTLPDGMQPIQIIAGNSQAIHFRFVLTPSQIEAIEALRSGGGFDLHLWLCGEVWKTDKSSGFVANSQFQVKHEDWIEALSKMEYRQTLLFEMPIPDYSKKDKAVATYIRKAQDYFYRGQCDDCVGECRKIIESIPKPSGEDNILGELRKKYPTKSDRQKMSVNERWVLFKDAVYLLTHPPHHTGQSEYYSRDQAKAILGAVLSLLSCHIPDSKNG